MDNEPSSSDTFENANPNGAIRSARKSRLSFVFALLSVVSVILIPVSRASLLDVDRQFANFGGIGAGLLALLFGFLAIATHRKISWPAKVAVGLAPFALIAVFIWRYEFSGFNGEVWPTFRIRTSDRSMPPSGAGFNANLSTHRQIPDEVAPFRFTQLLGNNRDGNIEAPEFSMDWSEKLPDIVWRREIGAGWSGFAIANGLAVTLEQRDEDEVLTALNLATGDTVWEYAVAGRHFHPLGGLGPRSTPTITELGEKSLVVTQTAVGVVMCVELATGQMVWQNDLLKLAGISQKESELYVMWGRSGSPLVFDETVIVPLGGNSGQTDQLKSLVAFNLSDGKERWRSGTSQIAYASPVLMTLDDELQIVSVNEGNATGHNPETGEVLWSSPWPSKSNGDACASQPVAVDANRLLLGKGYAQGSKLISVRRQIDESNPDRPAHWVAEDVWANTRILKTKFTSTIVYDGIAYALSDGVLECVEPSTGKRVWRGPRFGQGQMLIVNGTILVLSEDGRIASVDRLTGKTIGEMPVLEGITWNVPSVAGPYLLVRNGTQAVCLIRPANPG